MGHTSEPYRNGLTDRDAACREDWVGPGNHVLDGVHIPVGRGNFEGKGWPIVKYRDTAVICAKTAEPMVMPCGLCARTVPMNQITWVQIPYGKGHFRGKGAPTLKYGHFCREVCKNGRTNLFPLGFWIWYA